jgi:hypothetical protein
MSWSPDAEPEVGPGPELARAVEAALPAWVVRSVERVLVGWRGEADPAVMAEAAEAGARAGVEVGARLRALLEADIDDQRATPLAVVRDAVRFPTEVLRRAGVPPRPRDAAAEALFPDDDYDLVPGSLADLDPALGELAIAWGAWKAMAHRRRHGPTGR